MNPRLVVLLATLVVAAGCTPVAPTEGVPLDREFTLKPGTGGQIEGTDLRVVFQGVVSDSRCPADATCVQAGDAVVELRVGTALVQLRSSSAPEQVVGIYRVRLTRVEPYPATSQPIAPGDYRATLIVTRR